MLTELRLSQLGVIDEATLPIGPGFTAITGETGAGKTMVLTALGLVLGDRADPGLVRSGAARAWAEASFSLPAGAVVVARVRDAGGEVDDAVPAPHGGHRPDPRRPAPQPSGQPWVGLTVGRTVPADGPARAQAGGRTVPAALLSELGESLVTVHGQSDQRGLLRPSRQRQILDRYAGPDAAAALAAYRTAFSGLAAARAELAEVTGARRERAREADLLRHGIAEIEAVAPVAGEDRALAEQAGRLAAVDALRAAALTAHGSLAGDDATGAGEDVAAQTAVASARAALEAAQGHDPALDGLATRLAEVSYALADVAADLAGYLDRLDADPARLAAVQERTAALAALTRKYGEDAAAVLAWQATAAERLAALDGDDARLEELTDLTGRLTGELARAAAAVSALRRAAADRLAAAVTAELAGLAMPDAAVAVAVTQRPDERGLTVGAGTVAFGPNGVDDVEFLLVAHRGAPPRPLGKGASGGELSRVMLALEVALAGADPVPTFVFDEVDAGVGGRAAAELGRRLAALARHAQVLVVTHLPQVAAFADHHIAVRKDSSGEVTRSGVVQLYGEDRVAELSRMLAGVEDSALARGHAQELLAAAGHAAVGDPG